MKTTMTERALGRVAVRDALKMLRSMVGYGKEFPDAECEVIRIYSLTPAQAKELREMYDAP